MIDTSDVVAKLDPGLEVIKVFKNGPERFVYQVGKQGSIYVLKGSPTNVGGSEQIGNEKNCLERLDGVRGVPHIREFYYTSSYTAIMRDYTEGTLLVNAGKVVPNNFWVELDDLVDRVHSRGVSALDIKNNNILVCRGPTAALFDFDWAESFMGSSYAMQDKEDIQKLRDSYTRAA